MLGGRPLSLILSEARQPSNYVALWNMRRRYPAFREGARRYLFGTGTYPCRWEVRTPLGMIAPTLHSPDDMITVTEIFCREDYRAGPDLRVVVDIGSNIGISALYFLTRNHRARCYLYEPVPRNVGRLVGNLAGHEERYVVEEVAVADRAGRVAFGVEPTGRYGGIGAATAEQIEVACREVNDVLEQVLAREGSIDILKVDAEGSEVAIVAAIRGEHLERIRTIYFEWPTRAHLHPQRFAARFANQTMRLVNRRPLA
jgi:FkbM family methyltransferase